MAKYKWTKKQLLALRKSINGRWFQVVSGVDYFDVDECDCCENYGSCSDCPICQYSKEPGCFNTPYYKTDFHKSLKTGNTKSNIAEMNFLRKVYKAGGGKLSDLKKI